MWNYLSCLMPVFIAIATSFYSNFQNSLLVFAKLVVVLYIAQNYGLQYHHFGWEHFMYKQAYDCYPAQWVRISEIELTATRHSDAGRIFCVFCKCKQIYTYQLIATPLLLVKIFAMIFHSSFTHHKEKDVLYTLAKCKHL